MQLRTLSATVLTLACLMLGGCREHNAPAQPIAPAAQLASPAPASS
ncbi:ABC-type uncharacterized transport system auxiliary subunit [Massilia sp. MP_M2]